jgi:hypothetical protein
VDLVAVEPLLTELAVLIECDLGDAMDHVESLKAHLEGTSAVAQLSRLEQDIDSRDADSARARLRSLAESLSIPL